MKKRSKKNSTLPSTEESNGSTKSTSSSKGSKNSPRDAQESKLKKKEKSGDGVPSKRHSMNIERIKTDSIRKSTSFNFDLKEEPQNNSIVSIRKSRSKSEAYPSKKRNRLSSKAPSSLEDIIAIVLELSSTVSKLDSALQEEKSNRVIIQMLVKNQEEAIKSLKIKSEDQEKIIATLQEEINSLKEELKKVNFESDKSKSKSSKKVSKIKSEGKLQSYLSNVEKKKKSAKKTKSHPTLRADVKSPRDKKELLSGYSTPRSNRTSGSQDDFAYDLDDKLFYSNTSPKSETTDNHKMLEKRSSSSSVDGHDKKIAKKDLKSTFFLNFGRTTKPKYSLSTPERDDEGGYLSEGSSVTRRGIKSQRISTSRLSSTFNISTDSNQYLSNTSPISDRSTSPEPMTRVPRPYMLLPDKYKDELNIAPTPRSLAAAISNWTLNSKGIPNQLDKWISALLAEGFNMPDLFTKEVDQSLIDCAKHGSPRFKVEDPYVIAALIKNWFVELPDSLFMTSKYRHWSNAVQIDDDVRISFLKSLYYSLEETNRNMLKYMFAFFEALLDKSGCVIDIESIATVFGPIFLRDFNTIYTSRIGVTFGDLLGTSKEKSEPSQQMIASQLLDIILREPGFFEDEQPEICFEKIGRQYVVASATIENLAILLIDTNYTEREFGHIFWTTCLYFMSYSQLLKMLVDFYYRYEGESRWKANIRMRILMTIKTWVKSYAHVLSQDDAFKRILQEFTQQAKDNASRSTYNEDQVLHSLENSQLDGTSSNIVVLPPRPSIDPNNMIIDQYDGKTFASQVVLIHSEIMPSIEYTELLEVASNKKGTKKSSNYTTVVDFINNLTMWVAFDILKNNHVNSRIRAISYYIDVAHHCLSFHDYNGAWAIYGAIGLHIIQRLTTTWERMPKKEMAQFKKLESLFEPRMNFAEYRKRYEISIKEAGYAIPVLALIPMDIIRFEMEPTFIESRKIDFTKMRRIYATLQSLSRSNTKPLNTQTYEFTVSTRLWNWLWNYKDVDEVTLEGLSKLLEP